MLTEATLARPYARAAFELADQAGTAEAWSQSLTTLAGALQSDALRELVDHPKISEEQLLEVFGDVLGGSIDSAFKGFLDALMHYRRLPLLPEIAAQFETLRRRRDNRLKVSVVSAVEMAPPEQEKLAQRLRQRFGSEIEMETQIDESLIGGVLVRAGDYVIDASVRGRLEQLGRQLVR